VRESPRDDAACGKDDSFSENAPFGNHLTDPKAWPHQIDMTWYADALGAASQSGVSVFCRETLAGDWLETIGVWQQGKDLQPYTPHPDWWVATLWRKLMGKHVLPKPAVSAPAVASPSSTPPNLPADQALRVYAHSARPPHRGVALVLICLWGNKTMQVRLAGASAKGTIAFVLSSDDVSDDVALLNGEALRIGADETLPSLEGVPVLRGSLTLPPRAVAFVVHEPFTDQAPMTTTAKTDDQSSDWSPVL
jgi:hypothetical protein